MNEMVIDTLYKRSYDSFDEMINEALLDAEKNDKTYRKLYNINKKLRHKYPRIAQVLETENPQKLNSQEIDSLMTIINNEIEMKYIMFEKMFMLGNKEAYYYFKRMGIMREEDKN